MQLISVTTPDRNHFYRYSVDNVEAIIMHASEAGIVEPPEDELDTERERVAFIEQIPRVEIMAIDDGCVCTNIEKDVADQNVFQLARSA